MKIVKGARVLILEDKDLHPDIEQRPVSFFDVTIYDFKLQMQQIYLTADYVIYRNKILKNKW